MTETTLTAEEFGLRPAVALVGVAASVAPLTGMPRVNSNNVAADSLSLVFQEALELGKAPGVQSSLGLTAMSLTPSPYVRQVLYDNSGSRFNSAKDRSRKNVVTIPSEALFTPSEVSKMPLGTLRTVGLQSTFEPKSSLDDFFPMSFPVKAIIRSNSGAGDSKINADNYAIGREYHIRQFNHNMKSESAFAIDKVSRGGRTTDCVLNVAGKIERHLHSTLNSRQTNETSLPVDPEGMQVISRGAEHRRRARDLPALLLTSDCRLQSFSRFLSSLYVQIRNQLRQSGLAVTIGQTMKSVSVAVALFPSCAAHHVKRLRELLTCSEQSFVLLRSWLKNQPDCSFHKNTIPYN